MKNKMVVKRGAMEIDELIKLLIAGFFLVILVFGVIFLFKGGGGRILDSIRNLLRFGR